MFALQCWTTLPLIHQAERYESAEQAANPPSNADGASEGGFVRGAYTATGDVLVAIGFGMLLAGMYGLSGRYGLLSGVLWGLAGFATFELGPAAVVPPSIPGLELASLSSRQAAWLVAALSTGIGLAILAFGSRAAKFAGILLLTLPTLLFRAIVPLSGGDVPSQALANLEHLFVVRVLGSSLLFWLVLGGLSGHFFASSAELREVADPRAV